MSYDQPPEAPDRTIRFSSTDLRAARRLLRVLLDSDRVIAETLQEHHPAATPRHGDRATLIGLAQDAFENRRRRAQLFGRSMFGEAAWDMLLALYILDSSGARQTVGDLMKLAGTPTTTANRWLSFLIGHGLVRREEHPTDRRTTFIRMTDAARSKLDEYFSGTVRRSV